MTDFAPTIHVELTLNQFAPPGHAPYFRADIAARSHPDRDRGDDMGASSCAAPTLGAAVAGALANLDIETKLVP